MKWLSWLPFGWSRSAPTAPGFRGSPPQPDAAFVAIGDIHGRDDLLARLLSRLEQEAPGLPLIFVGDYVDRGEASAGVLRRLNALCEDGRAVCLCGNHEDMMLDFARGKYPRWLAYGGLQTLASFGLGAEVSEEGGPELEAAQEGLAKALEAEGLHEWLTALPRYWQSGNVAVTHAGADPSRPIAAQRHSLTYGHPGFFSTPRPDGIWVVHGHYIRDEPEVVPGRIAIDTGAYATGRLTAVIMAPGETPRFIEA
ncbi:metallophosphoesterase [Vannielia litorea]|uniref:metallophosphoesterase n=1 Tax=Vannielia litorea TaxID=1217970 RepID=UPI001C95ACDB|nr:metallophosphoesterase [Vannielia litorea]MBY6049192.1 metallophosphoesterase [Vannielia litorea]MBY6076606.1 metallophosphoesterase [Vannielia litorea]